MNTEGDRNVHANDNSGENTDTEEDIFNQPTQAFTHIDKSPNKILGKEIVTISSSVDNFKDNSDENTDSEEDIFNQPTQAFSKFNPSPKLLKQKGSQLSSSVQGDPDNTQDIMEAFEMVPVKSDPENSDSDDESLIATQPFQVRGSPAKAKHQNDDDYVPTQLFLEDDDEIVFKKPFTVAPKFRKSYPSVAISNDDISDELFNDDNQDVLDTPTQAFVADDKDALEAPTQAFAGDDKDALEAPTQAFAGDDKDALEAPTQAFAGDDKVSSKVPTQAFYNDQVPSEAPTQAFDDLPPTQKFDPKQEGVSKEKEPEAKLEGADSDSDVDDYFNQPTQPFLAKENTDRSLLERPTQCFRATPQKNITKYENDEIDDIFNEPTQAFAETKHRIDTDSDAPTQLFGNKSEDVEALSEDESLPPTQIFTAPSPNVLTPKRDEQVDDSLVPTQPFTSKDSRNTPQTSEDTSTHSEPDDINAPTQIFQEQDSNEPPQVFHDEIAKSDENIAPTQVFQNDANAIDGDCRASTQLFIPEDKTSPVNRPQRGISEIWDKLDADATQDISLNVDVNIDETRLANESKIQVLSERKELVNKEDYKGSDMNNDDDNSSTVSENLLEQTTQPHYQDCLLKEAEQKTKDENYYSDESTDMEDEMLAPKDAVKVQEVTNNTSILQTSNMSRLELSSDSDIIPEVKGTVTQSPKNEKSHQEKKGPVGNQEYISRRVSKVIASDPVVALKSVGKAAKYSQSTQDSICVEDVKIYSSDSDDSDSMDSRTCKSVSKKVKKVAEILSDSETDDDVGNVSQRLFELSQEDEVDKGIGKQTSNEDKFEEEYHHNTKGRGKTEKQDKQIHTWQCQKTVKDTVENMTKDNEQNIQKEDKKETPVKSKINTRKNFLKQIQSPIESHSKNDIRNMIKKKEIVEKSDKCKEVGAEETKCNRTTRERRQDKNESLDLNSGTEQKTKIGRIRREPRKFSPDRDLMVAETSSASVISKGKILNISKNMKEDVGVRLSKRTRSSTPFPLKRDYGKNEEVTTVSSSARLGNSSDTDPNRVDSPKKGLQQSVPQTKEIQPKRVGILQGKDSGEIVVKQVRKDPGERERRSASKTLKEPKVEEQVHQSNLETENLILKV
ncbi:transcriptional regulator ATRX-like [Penaeus monodon]|uniref:transcriptional regulator ATRX-like n=1 Tax=Penaeus monodon TaxID=6687 RepID=UPI0018A6FE4C|nr:transcriptional regulator ATRX-like [Penaeus monodon]